MNNKVKALISISSTFTLATLSICAINKCIDLNAIKRKLESPEETHTYNWKFGDIQYTKSGKGSPLLLIHDLSCWGSRHEWDKLKPALEKNHTVYTLDLLGCGESSKPKFTYTGYLYVALVTDFIKHVVGKPVDIIGTGLSTSFILMSCSTESNLFNKLMLINPTDLHKLNHLPGKRSKLRKSLLETPIIGTFLYYILHSRKNAQKFLLDKGFFISTAITDTLISIAYDSSHTKKANGKYLKGSLAANYLNCNIARACQSINNSVMILGGKEKENICEILSLYQSLNPAIECEYIKDTKLFPHIEAPKAVEEQISIFFS